MRQVLSILATLALAPVLHACGTSTSEPARSEPVRVEAPHHEPPLREPGAAPEGEGGVPTSPRRVEATPPERGPSASEGQATGVEARRGHRPMVEPPPVEPPTF